MFQTSEYYNILNLMSNDRIELVLIIQVIEFRYMKTNSVFFNISKRYIGMHYISLTNEYILLNLKRSLSLK
jgi:hypothetical protein